MKLLKSEYVYLRDADRVVLWLPGYQSCPVYLALRILFMI